MERTLPPAGATKGVVVAARKKRDGRSAPERGEGRLAEILDEIESGEVEIAAYKDELTSLLPGSRFASAATAMDAFNRVAAGEISMQEAVITAREQAGLHPAEPFFFQCCMGLAMLRENEV